ncbi:MAG TPA: twin-arginine translocation signal domain-containing protein [Campylobacterales bacterium]|nr:twin-arginine translocation signal domain-containing protein [Campylobacterales bacterium]
MQQKQTFAEVFQSRGLSRRDFLKFCSLTSVALGLAPSMLPKVVHAMETKPRTPVIWLHGLECTCCTESFIRSSHPIVADVIMNMISLDYDDTLSAAAGHQLEAVRKQIMKDYKGQYILAVEGNVPTKDDGMYCIIGGDSFKNVLKETAAVTSKFYQKANNVFGVWSFDSKEKRLSASKKRGNRTIYLKKYQSMEASIYDYLLTLSKKDDYKEFREKRLETKDPYKLADYLTKYSEEREKYTKRVKDMIKKNRLARYDKYQLDL